MSGRGQHDLAHHGVAELEDRVDEPALLDLDRLLVGRDVGHRAEVLLGDERALPSGRCPGSSDVGEADQARATGSAAAGSTVIAQRKPDTRERGAVGVLDRVRLGRHLADHEEEDDLEHEPDEDTGRAERVVEHDAEQRRARRVARSSTRNSSELSVCSGRSSIFASRAAPLRPSSSSASARMRLIRVNAVSQSGEEDRRRGTARRRSRRMTPVAAVHRPACPARRVARRRRRPVVASATGRRAARNWPAAPAPVACIRRVVLRLGVVVAEQVQHAVDDEQRELVVEVAPACSSAWLSATAGQTTTSPITIGGSSTRRALRDRARPRRAARPLATTSSSIGNASTSVGPSPSRKRSLRSVIVCRSTKSTEISASGGTRSSASTSSASRTQRSTSTGDVALLVGAEDPHGRSRFS